MNLRYNEIFAWVYLVLCGDFEHLFEKIKVDLHGFLIAYRM
jgi:hypothetical protein